MQRSLAWLDQRGARSKVVVTAFGNDAAIGFYRKFGFFAETLSLRQVPGADGVSGVAERPV